MSQVSVKSYINYFRTLAVIDEDIQHNPLSEDDDSGVYEKKFTRWSADEVVSGLRNAVGWPACLLEMFEITTRAEVPYDVKGIYQGAFTILDHATPDNTKEEVDALDRTERIYKNFLKMIYQDHYGKNKDRCTTPFAEFYFNNLVITPVGPLFQNEFGFRVEFTFKPINLLNIKEPPNYGTIEEVLPPDRYLYEDGYIEVPAGRLVEKVFIEPEAESTIKAGTTQGSSNLILEEEQSGGVPRTASFDLVCKIPTKIWFTGIWSKTKIIIYTRSISV